VYVHHALVNDRVASGLADDEVSPLHDHDRHEERGVTCVLEHLALRVRLIATHSSSSYTQTTATTSYKFCDHKNVNNNTPTREIRVATNLGFIYTELHLHLSDVHGSLTFY